MSTEEQNPQHWDPVADNSLRPEHAAQEIDLDALLRLLAHAAAVEEYRAQLTWLGPRWN